ncbi:MULTISPECIES: DUF397 domain-containing protein [Streptomyces]|uniref:DUF397 domain-containing protein n=1 Tax=Streptomyces TaxID=1883 RepID=UPI001F37ECC2|nr:MULTISPECIES: DUF397 domain-containing protein [Streptomyces]MCF0085418.1 hypothetical protein [Streptomyces sp. MH192]MCF0097852.1 hypothetical protein [Streptomyces sp. MH191]WTI28877.1 DUF397 domain-containing protein [Streptomyces jietaisiensis]
MTPDRDASTDLPRTWTRSTYSGAEGGDCLEAAVDPNRVHLRDSKDTTRPGPAVGHRAWTAFLGFVAGGARD